LDRYASTNERIGSPFDSEGLMFGPGLECEHMMTFSVGSSALDANYEYSWSDWPYYIHLSSKPVETHLLEYF